MKAIWKGSISFGLVSIPMVLYSASKDSGVSFKMLHATCKSPLKYKKWCESEDVEVPWKDVAKGLEIAEDTYFVLSKEELAKIKPEKTSSVDIKGFVNDSQIDKIYFEKSYFVGPQNEKDKAFFLFRDALAESSRIAIGSFVMHENEHLCMIQNYKKGLLLTTLRFADEVRSIEDVPSLKGKVNPTEAEMKLANELISKLILKNFDIADYRETFVDELKTLIKKKIAGEKIPTAKPKVKAEKSLIQALKASIE